MWISSLFTGSSYPARSIPKPVEDTRAAADLISNIGLVLVFVGTQGSDKKEIILVYGSVGRQTNFNLGTPAISLC